MQVGSAEYHNRLQSNKERVRFVTAEAESVDEHTAFEVSRAPNQAATFVKVTEGSAVVTPRNSKLKPRILKAGEQMTVYPDRLDPPDAGSAQFQPGKDIPAGLSVGRRYALPGERVAIPVYLGSNASSGIANMNFSIAYDATKAVADGGVAAGNLATGKWIMEGNSNLSGEVLVGVASSTGVSGTGTVAQIPFRVSGQPGDVIVLRLTLSQCQGADGKNVPLATTSGAIIVKAPAQPDTPTNVSAAPDDRTPPIPPGARPGALANADADGDGRLTLADAKRALRMSVGLEPPNPRLDVSGDGKVLSEDSRMIQIYAVGQMARQ